MAAMETNTAFKTLASTYGVGVSPLREALSRLASERLVTASGQRGFRVPPVSAAEMWEVIRLRQLLEREALADAIARGDAAWESAIVAAFHRLTRAAPGDGLRDPKAYGLLLGLSSHDHYTLQHSVGVATNSIILANKIGIDDEAAFLLREQAKPSRSPTGHATKDLALA